MALLLFINSTTAPIIGVLALGLVIWSIKQAYNERNNGCGYIENSVACRKKCHGETGGRYSWLFFLVLAILTYLYLQ